jgi:hypothetical protein
MSVKFKNPSKMTKAWGEAEPVALRKIFDYLCDRRQFSSPDDWGDPYSLVLQKELSEDFFFKVTFSTAGQSPVGVFLFDVYLVLYSKYCRRIETDINLWPNTNPEINIVNPGSAIFSITLSHLKWNELPTDKNPIFKLSKLPGYESVANEWISDWEQFAMPIVESIFDLESVIRYCQFIKNYAKKSWVKSDGYLSSTLDIHMAFLYVRDGQYQAAIDILQASIELHSRAAGIERLNKALSWVLMNQKKGKQMGELGHEN